MKRPPRRCPFCGEKKGWIRIRRDRTDFSFNKAAIGYLAGGPLGGLFFGIAGDRCVLWGCQRCGYMDWFSK